ncbi:SUKH-3 domain-containing protein [Cryptosporangium aurantiacum]|uniref:SUKH-3 immunity protein n=1 Tax=Cryptosporangium aurantiacum TaxID=134849 RepID=A0A1M7NIR4_9ACTN|nr:SUKH-3 domain-containing protein [Cryptosporangium aurantiacum]SHN03143.1 SUKH-3 immunity protein [Cryptosporangium aurantiacum]
MSRFPTEVETVLRASGWTEGRRVPEASAEAIRIVCAQPGADGSRHVPFPAAEAVLAEFGGIFVRQDEPGRELRRRPFALDPTMAAATAATLADLGRLLGVRLFPLGVEGDGDAVLTIDEQGRVFAFDHAGEWFLGPTVEAALITLITGTSPARVRDDGTW